MSATATLKAAHAAGIRLGIDGDALVLEASAPPPPDLFDLISRHKADILILLRTRPIAVEWRALVTRGLPPPAPPSEIAQARAHKSRVVDWQNAHPASSPPESCALCTGPETWGNTLIPFGVGPHAWLHSDCWPSWRDGRIKDAEAALVVADRSASGPTNDANQRI